MKAKVFYNKLLAIALIVVLVALSVPAAIFMVSASDEAPTVDAATDIGSYVNFYDSTAHLKEYDETGSLKVGTGVYAPSGVTYEANGVYYASVRMEFDPHYEYKYTANTSTGKWEQPSGNAGIEWGQTGFKIGTYSDGGNTRDLTVAYRRGQGSFLLINNYGVGISGTSLSGISKGYNTVELTVKYDSASKKLSFWEKADGGAEKSLINFDVSGLAEFNFTGFNLRSLGAGSHPADFNDINNTNKVNNYVTFSNLHIWGDVSTTKHYMAPSIGDNTNIANTLTLSDATLNTDWKADGEFAWNFTNATFNGIDFANNDVVYASVTITGVVKGGGSPDIYGVSFANEGTKRAFNYLRPQWNQQGVSGTTNVTLTSSDGWGNAGTDGSLKSTNTQDEVFIYKFDTKAKTVDVWRRTAIYSSHWANIYVAPYQDIYVGKYSIGEGAGMALGIYVNPSADISTFTGNPTVKDVKVWVEGGSAGSETDVNFTLSDATLDTQYKQNGSITINSTNGVVYLNGFEVKKNVGQKITYSFDMQYSAAANTVVTSGGKDHPAFVFAKNTTAYAGLGTRPAWQQTRVVANGCSVEMNMLDNSLSGAEDKYTGSFLGSSTAPIKFKAVYDVDANTIQIWMDAERVGGCYESGNMLVATATLGNGFEFAPGISAENVTGGSMTVSNISLSTTETGAADEDDNSVNFTLSDSALDTEYKQNGSVVMDSTNGVVYLSGYEVKKNVGQKITYSFDMQYSAAANTVVDGTSNHYAFVFAKNATTYAGVGTKPAWQQTREKIGCSYTMNMFNNFLSSAADKYTGSFNGSSAGPIKFKAVYDVDSNSIQIWMDAVRVGGCYESGNMLIATATLDNGFEFAPGISAENITGGTITVTNISITAEETGGSGTDPDDTPDVENKLQGISGLEGGTLNSGVAYNSADLGVSNTPVWTEGTTVNSTGTYVTQKVGGYDGKKTVVWKGLEGDLSKGSITYEADLTVYNKTTDWNGTNWGFVVATVNGHYVTCGIGLHGAVGANTYKFATAIDGSNIGEQAGANTAFLGANSVGGTAVTGTTAGTVVKLKVVLTATSITTYIDDTLGQTFNLTGKTVVPVFAFAWGSGNAADSMTNVKIYGNGVSVQACEHQYSYACDTTCDLCGETREVEEWTHEYNSGCAMLCKNCNVARASAPEAHDYKADCDEVCDVCKEERTAPGTHNYSGSCDDTCNNCGTTRTGTPDHTFDDDNDTTCNICNAKRVITNTLFVNGGLATTYKAHLANGVPTTGALALNPNQFASASIALGGLVMDASKGYTLEADFIVKTNSSMESHFGITAAVIDGVPYTFGMLSNGNWGAVNTPTQAYVPYLRKKNDNSLLGASGPTVTATDAGVTVKIKVVVTDSTITYYINGTEAKVLDIAGAEVAPYAAFNSRGANVEVANIKIYGAGVTSCEIHTYDGECDSLCNECFGGYRTSAAHTYDNETCDDTCNKCNAKRTVTHVYSAVCDDICDVCSAKRNVTHTYDDECDAECNVCNGTRTAPHKYTNDCDTDCDNGCGHTRYVNNHVFTGDNNKCENCDFVKPDKPNFDDYVDHTADYYINETDYRVDLAEKGEFTIYGNGTTSGGGLLAKSTGKIVLTSKLTFNGNVDFEWKKSDGNNYAYANSWGKYGLLLGTYYDTAGKAEAPLYISFRRCAAAAYLFNNGNLVNGSNAAQYNFGAAASKAVESITMVALYNIDEKTVSLWIDDGVTDKYVGTCYIGELQNFKFNTGFVTQGTGTSAVDPTDPTNPEVTQNSVTFSEFRVLGDLEKDPNFQKKPAGVSPPAGSLAAPNPADFDDLTSSFHLDNGKLDKELTAGKFTAEGDHTALGAGGVVLKEGGSGYISTVMKFNGNVDFIWSEVKKDNVGTGKYAYTNGWGKYGIKIGTYTRVERDENGNVKSETKNIPVYVSWRRCTANAYLFDNSNAILGSFGSCGKTDASEVKMTVKYDDKLEMIYLWIDDYFVKAVPTSQIKDFAPSYGFVIQGTGTTAVDASNPNNKNSTPNSVTFSDVKVFGDFIKDPNYVIPVLEPMKDNLAKYIELRSGSNIAAYFNREFSGQKNTEYVFGGLEYDEKNTVYQVSFDYVITSRDRQKDGTEISWGSIRLGVMEAQGYKYQLATLPKSASLLANGGGYAGYSAPGFSEGSKTGEKHNITIQYNLKTNRFSVWFDGERVIRAVELPDTNAKGRKLVTAIHFEGCTADISNLKIWGTGLSVNVSDEYKALLNDPFYTSTTIPAKPEGNINYWQYISAVNKSGDLAFDMIDDEFETFWSDEQGRVGFRDSYGNRNLNGITNDTTFVARFKYRALEDDPDYVAAKKQRGSIFTLRGYNLPTSQGKKNNYQIAFYNDSIVLSVLRDDAVKSSSTAAWNREVNKEYDIAIVSAPNWVKVFVDGKLKLAAGGLYQYTFDFCYEAVHCAADFWDVQLYDVRPNDAAEPVKNHVPEKTLTGTTVNTIEHTKVPLATGTISIWMIIFCLGAVLCLAGAAVFTVKFVKKKNEDQ